MPWTSTKAMADEKCPNGDWNREGDECGDSGNGANRDDTAKNQRRQADADNGVEPHCLDGSLGIFIDPFPDAGEREAIVTGVSVCDSAGSHHTALTHAKAANDCETEDGEGGLFWHDLEEVCGPWLAEVRVEYALDVNDSIRCDELEKPAKEPAEAKGHYNSTWRGDVSVAAFF